MNVNEPLINVPGRLHSTATQGHIAGANELYDDDLGQLQSEINANAQNAIVTVNQLKEQVLILTNILLDVVGWKDLFVWNNDMVWASDIKVNITWPNE